YKPDDANFHQFAVYDYRGFLGYLTQKVEFTKASSTAAWVKKTTDLRHYNGTMPGRRWLAGVLQQQWHRTSEGGSVLDYVFAEAYAYDWQGRRVGKNHCATTDTEHLVDDYSMTCEDCGKPGGITYDYDGANVLVER